MSIRRVGNIPKRHDCELANDRGIGNDSAVLVFLAPKQSSFQTSIRPAEESFGRDDSDGYATMLSILSLTKMNFFGGLPSK